MSQDNLKLFLEAMATDESLKASLAALSATQPKRQLDQAEGEAIWATQIIPLAKSKGFDFTLAEVHEYLAGHMNNEPVKLSDEELDAVAAGASFRCWCLMYGSGSNQGCTCVWAGFGTVERVEACACMGWGYGNQE